MWHQTRTIPIITQGLLITRCRPIFPYIPPYCLGKRHISVHSLRISENSKLLIHDKRVKDVCARTGYSITSARHYFAEARVISTVINERSCDMKGRKKRCCCKCVNLFSDYSLLYKQMFPRDRLVFGTDLGTGWFGKVGRLVFYYSR